jgi:hypothetical protein
MYYPIMYPIRSLLICLGIPLASVILACILVSLANRFILKEKKIPIARAIRVAIAFGFLIAFVVGCYVSGDYWAS